MSEADVAAGIDGAAEPPDNLARYLERKKSCPLIALGHSDGRYYFLTPQGELRGAEARDMTERGLGSLAGGDAGWFIKQFPRFGPSGLAGFEATKSALWLMRECARAGLWDANTPVRGPGVWRAGAGVSDGLLVHCGDAVIDRGRERPAGLVAGGAVYPARPPIGRPADRAAGAGEAAALIEAVGLWNWRDQAGPDLVTGFIGASLLGGAARWRAHLYVLARFGSGKSWLAELVGAALGAMAHATSNNFTEAGLRQALTSQARTLLLDEAEGDDSGHRLKAVIELIRHMSGGRGARVMRGTAGGQAQTFTITGSAYLSSVLPGILKPQDRSRITLVELAPLHDGPEAAGAADRAQAAIAAMAALAPGLWRRAIDGWVRFNETFEAYRTALMDDGSAAREADQLATLLAGRDLLLRDEVPAHDEIRRALARIAGVLAEARDEAADDEGEACLNHLYSSGSGTLRHGRELTVAEIVMEGRELNSVDARRDMQALGLRLEGSIGAWTLLIANRHQGLAHIFRDTRWRDGGHVQALRYLAGAAAHPRPIKFAGVLSRAVVLPMRLIASSEDPAEPAPGA